MNIARRKNPSYVLTGTVTESMFLSFFFFRLMALLRGLRLGLNVSSSKFILLGRNVRISGKKHFIFGRGVQISDNVKIIAYGKNGLFIGDHSWIGANSFLKVSFSFNDPGEFIRIGKNVGIGEFAHLGGAGGLLINDDCIIGPYFSCHPENHSFISDELIRLQPVTRKGISIGKNCWIGAKVTILDSVTIGDNCVIAAGAVLTKDMPPNSVIAGVPARIIRMRNEFDSSSLKVAV